MLNLYTYWENPQDCKTPPYIDVCLNSMRNLSKTDPDIEFHVINEDNAEEYVKDAGLHPNWKRLHNIAHRADCVRVATIAKNGGMWVDADTVFLSSPRYLFDMLMGDKKFLYCRWTDGRVLNGYFAAKKDCQLMQRWLGLVNNNLCSQRKNTTWTAFGEPLITSLIYMNEGSAESLEMDRRIFLPVNIDKIPNIFFEEISYAHFVHVNHDWHSVAVGLNHSFFCDNYPGFTRQNTDQIKHGDLMINKLMRDAV